MKLEIILLIIISIGFGISLVYFIGYNKISIIKAKMDAANDIISKALKDKKDIMNEIYDKYKTGRVGTYYGKLQKVRKRLLHASCM